MIIAEIFVETMVSNCMRDKIHEKSHPKRDFYS
jgi:hypothetical protein